MKHQLEKIIKANKSKLPVCAEYWEIILMKNYKKPITIPSVKHMTGMRGVAFPYKPLTIIIDNSKFYEK